jgi:hypothetical protein
MLPFGAAHMVGTLGKSGTAPALHRLMRAFVASALLTPFPSHSDSQRFPRPHPFISSIQCLIPRTFEQAKQYKVLQLILSPLLSSTPYQAQSTHSPTTHPKPTHTSPQAPPSQTQPSTSPATTQHPTNIYRAYPPTTPPMIVTTDSP